jgi:hypothetical protein
MNERTKYTGGQINLKALVGRTFPLRHVDMLQAHALQQPFDGSD